MCKCIKNLYRIGVRGLSSINKYISSNASHISYSDILLKRAANKTERHVGLWFHFPMWYVVRVTYTRFYNSNMQNGIWFFFLRFQNINRVCRSRQINEQWNIFDAVNQRCSYKAKWKRCIEWFYIGLCSVYRIVYDDGGETIMIYVKVWTCFINKCLFIYPGKIRWMRIYFCICLPRSYIGLMCRFSGWEVRSMELTELIELVQLFLASLSMCKLIAYIVSYIQFEMILLLFQIWWIFHVEMFEITRFTRIFIFLITTI